MRVMLLAALGAAGLMLTNCASVTRGTTETVSFDSDPPGAEMRSTIVNPCAESDACTEGTGGAVGRGPVVDRSIKAGPACTTPCVAPVPRNQNLIVTFSKAGYEPRTERLAGTVRPGGAAGVVGNAIAGGLVGVAIDAGTGAALDHCPNPMKVTLRKIGAREPLVPFDTACAPPPVTAEGMPSYQGTEN